MSAAQVIVATGVRADHDLLATVARGELDRLGVTGTVTIVDGAAAVRERLAAGTPTVVVPGRDPDTRALMALDGPHAAATVWYDIEVTGPAPVAPGAAHLYGRGVWGLVWAIRHAVLRLRHPATRIGYGPGPEQYGELRLPPAADQPVPVAVLLHGGFWRSVWAADLMDALAVDLAARGFAAWNLEYRRPDRSGWAATVSDVAAGLSALSDVDAPVDLDRVAVLGHSAGGQLALRVAADHGRVALAVPLAGVLDLAGGDGRGIGTGAVTAALGGPRYEVPEVYAASDPMARVPIGVPQLVVQGADDDLDLIDFNRRYVAAARAAGDDVRYVEEPGDHFSVIDPAAPLWHTTADALATALKIT
ncbi:alpha/beta hydrolase [Phytohabitans sp. ZYX-F-186]|uniref:Alpha/beta hydrolase n=1 Tax=Phytohabitans maris TaxID=3071409 RepID=A0ABU0ZD52_9ACTN|nr:alpha/beta hydrolase [Phytohabitans sp. ZYX-F-186]MDQ7904898.1 alpha/beta hydrolase [Phytohabitans sp. ZYX-F-186]